jgi:hypothetical protein
LPSYSVSSTITISQSEVGIFLNPKSGLIEAPCDPVDKSEQPETLGTAHVKDSVDRSATVLP